MAEPSGVLNLLKGITPGVALLCGFLIGSVVMVLTEAVSQIRCSRGESERSLLIEMSALARSGYDRDVDNQWMKNIDLGSTGREIEERAAARHWMKEEVFVDESVGIV